VSALQHRIVLGARYLQRPGHDIRKDAHLVISSKRTRRRWTHDQAREHEAPHDTVRRCVSVYALAGPDLPCSVTNGSCILPFGTGT
jgi:hypothetical protein